MHGLMMKRVEVKGFGQKCGKFWSTRLVRMKKEKTIYRTIIRSRVIYGSEVGALSRSDENTLKMSERKILRKIFEPL